MGIKTNAANFAHLLATDAVTPHEGRKASDFGLDDEAEVTVYLNGTAKACSADGQAIDIAVGPEVERAFRKLLFDLDVAGFSPRSDDVALDGIVEDQRLAPGDIAFLTRVSGQGMRERYDLSAEPVYTNQGRRPIVFGWAGSTNNVALEALGLAEIVKATRHQGVSADHYRRLGVDETKAALAKLGWCESDGILVRTNHTEC